MYMRLRESKAFTLVEIMIVVAIIGLLIAIALPNFVKARDNTRRKLCSNNIRLIGSAVEQELIADSAAAMPDTAGLAAVAGPYIKSGFPVCPSAGTYTVTGRQISCTAAGHDATYDVQPTT